MADLPTGVVTLLADQFVDGVFLVPLAPMSEPTKVVASILQTLEINEADDQPAFNVPQHRLKDN